MTRDMSSFPVIRLEVESMKYAIISALSQHAATLDGNIRASVDQFCSSENIGAVVQKAVDDTLSRAIREEIDNFFIYGAGRQAIISAVGDRLNGAFATKEERLAFKRRQAEILLLEIEALETGE